MTVVYHPEAETQVNTYTAGSQYYPNVVALTGGGYVIVWASFGQDGSDYGIYAQMYDATGTKSGSEFRINTTTANLQSWPDIAPLSSGGFVVVWHSLDQDASATYGIYSQRYDATGTKVGSETLVNTTTAGEQSFAEVATLTSGGYVVVWQSSDASNFGIYMQRYTSAGAKSGSETLVNTTTSGNQRNAAVTALSGGGYVLAWDTNGNDGSDYGVAFQVYDASGTKVGSETLANTTTSDAQQGVILGALSGGGFVALWYSNLQDGSGLGVYMQRFTATGTKAGSETLVNSTSANDQYQPALTLLSDGSFIIAWASESQDGSGYGVYTQKFTSSGVKLGTETLVNTTTSDNQLFPALTTLSNGDYVIAWASNNQDGSGSGVFKSQFAANNPPALTGSQATLAHGSEDTAYNVTQADLVTGFTDGDSETLSVTGLTADHGTVTDNHDGTFTVTHAANYNGAMVLSYSVTDGADSIAATLGYTVDAVNDAPTGAPTGTLADGSEDTAQLILATTLLAGLSDAENDTLSVASISVDHGTLTATTGGWTFMPSANYNGAVTLTYSVSDGNGGTLSGLTRGFNLAAVNDAPRGTAPALAAGTEDVTYTVTGAQLRAGFSDTESDTLSVQNLTATYSQGYVAGAASYFQQNLGAYMIAQQALTGGNFVEVCRAYNNGWFYFTKILDASGAEVAKFNVSDPATVIALSDGSFVITSVNNYGTGTNDVAATHYSATGTVLHSQRTLVATSNHEQGTVGFGTSDGGYLMAWTDYGASSTVKFQKFNADGTTNGAVAGVTTSPGFDQSNVNIANNDDGSFVATWIQSGSDGSGSGVYAQRFNASGTAVGASFLVNTTTTSHQYGPRVATLEGGGFVVMWSDLSTGTRAYQVYDSSGAAVSSEKHISGTTIYWLANYSWSAFEQQGNVVALPDGGFAVLSTTSSNSLGLFRYDALGNQLGGQTNVVTDANGTATLPKLTLLTDGSLEATWSDDYNGGRVWSRNFVNDPGGAATVTYNAGTDTYSITRPADTNGLLTIDYQVSDGHGGMATASTTLNINAVNDAPRGSSSTTLTAFDEDGTITVSRAQLLAGYSDPDTGATLAIRNNTVTSSSGTVSYNSSAGTWTITPTANFNGALTLSYTVWDGSANATNGGSLSVTVNAVNDAPVLTSAKASLTGTEDVAKVITLTQLKQGYSDADGDTISISGVTANHGTLTDNGDGTFTLIPEADYNGVVTLSYTVSDGNGGSLSTTLGVSLAAVNDAPRGTPDGTVSNGTEDTPQVILAMTLLSGLSDVEGNSLSVSAISADHGTLTATAGGWTFAPEANYSGPVVLTYSVSDGTNAVSGLTRSFNLEAVNDAPVLTSAKASLAGTEDVTKVITLAQLQQGYSDADGDTISVSGVTADHGTLTDNGDGTFTLIPEADYNGVVTLSYTVSDGNGGSLSTTLGVSLAAVNDTPRGAPDGTVDDGAEDTTQVILATTLLSGLSDVEGNSLSVSAISADHGTLTATSGGWTFAPEANYSGPVVLTYSVSDGTNAVSGLTRSFNLEAVNDAPALTSAKATLTGTEDIAQVITLTQLKQGYGDADGDTISVSGLSADHGTVIDNGDNSFTLTPDADYDGTVTLSYTLNDGNGGSLSTTLGVSLAAVNDAPRGTSDGTVSNGTEDTPQVILATTLLSGLSDVEGNSLSVSAISADHGTLTATAGGWTFAPEANYSGPVVLTYSVSDGTNTISGLTRSFNLEAANDAPFGSASGVLAGGTEDTDYIVQTSDLLAGFSDIDGDNLSITGLAANHGSVTDNQDGTFTITPDDDYYGDVTLTYLVSDGTISISGSLVFNLGADNDAPALTGAPATLTGTEDVATTVTRAELLQGFNDVDGDALTVSGLSSLHGQVTDNGDGTYIITTRANTNGVITLTYGVGDSHTTTLASLDLTIAAANDLPSLTAPPATLADGTEDTVYSFTTAQLLQGWSDVDSDGLSVSGVTADHSTIIYDAASNTYSLTPDNDYFGTIVITYDVSDGYTTVPATLSLTLAQVADTLASATSATLSPFLENLTLTGSDDIDGTGNALTNQITGNAGSNRLDGGLGADTLSGAQGNDTYVIDDAGDSVIESGDEGHDTVLASVSFSLAGNAVEDLTLTGTADIDATGNALSNLLTGNSGNNRLDGGSGDDTMVGGDGDDEYLVDSADDVILESADEGTDTVRASVSFSLTSGLESLVLGGFADLDGTGNDASNAITGNNGANRLDGGLGSDSLTGGNGNDTYIVDNAGDVVVELPGQGTDEVRAAIDYSLTDNVENLVLSGSAIAGTGNALANTLTGNVLANSLDGKAGADTLIGGDGNDTYFVDSTSDLLIETEDGGTDTVISARTTYVLGNNLEILTFRGTAAFNGTGNALNNTLNGAGGNDSLNGGDGDDTLNGQAGTDSLSGGRGNDTYTVDAAGDTVNELDGEGADTVRASVSHTLSAFVETLVLTGTGAIDGTGNALANAVTGTSGNNRLDGGSGADSLIGGAGNDTYMVDNAGDLVVELAAQGADEIRTAVDYTLADNIENLVLIGTAISASGNALANSLTGNALANILDGKAGADTLAGGDGNDTYYADSLNDSVVEGIDGGVDTVISARTAYTLGDNIEVLTFRGTAAFNGTGNALNNTINGATGNDNLNGGDGSDVLNGAAGNDTLCGGRGGDTYYVDSVGDNVVEQVGEGSDLVIASLSYTLVAEVESLLLSGSNNIDGTGNSLNNTITGNSGNNRLDGGLSADTLIGGLGNDTYAVDNAGDILVELAGQGTDEVQSAVDYSLADNFESLTLTGTAVSGNGNGAANLLTGTALANILDGKAGADTMAGGDGNDTYYVDNTSDAVVEGINGGIDTVISARTTFSLADNVDILTFRGTAGFNGTGNALDNIVNGATGNDVLNGGDGQDTLNASSGNDSLNGGAGIDTMNGGLGDDTYAVDDSFDRVIELAGQGRDEVRASISYTLGNNVESLVLNGSALTGTGNGVANSMTGNGLANTLDGKAGDDSMTGGAGDDLYYVDSDGDLVVELSGEGTDSVRATVSYTLAEHVEKLVLTGAGNLNGTGNGSDNYLTGNSSGNSLYGLDGADILDGAAGDDTMAGGAGDDKYYVDSSADVITEEAACGTDNVRSTASYTLGANVEMLALVGSTDLYGTGNALNNTINGNAGNNTLSGGLGEDVLSGADGNDALYGDAGSDSLSGGLGDDSYYVDSTSDRVKENADAGTDSVFASVTFVLGSTLENLWLTGSASINGTGNAADNVMTGNGGNNRLTGGLGADAFTFFAQNGQDVIADFRSDQGDRIVIEGDSYSLSQNGANAIIDLGDGNTITVLNMTATDSAFLGAISLIGLS